MKNNHTLLFSLLCCVATQVQGAAPLSPDSTLQKLCNDMRNLSTQYQQTENQREWLENSFDHSSADVRRALPARDMLREQQEKIDQLTAAQERKETENNTQFCALSAQLDIARKEWPNHDKVRIATLYADLIEELYQPVNKKTSPCLIL